MDLKRRGLLDSTLDIFATEFRRMPMFQAGTYGLDHKPDGFTCWLARAGVRKGARHGATDEFDFAAVENRITSHDFHPTILHLRGLDHKRLSHFHNGIHRCLTDVHGSVIQAGLAQRTVRRPPKFIIFSSSDSCFKLTKALCDMEFPVLIESEDQLDDVLTTPSTALIEAAREFSDPLVILGAGGKMGPTLAVLAKRACQSANRDVRIVAASRFGDRAARQRLERAGVETMTVDVLDRQQLAKLPDARNVIYLVGLKFGTSSDPVPTWATNTVGPILACERYAKSRVVALSTGNVYPFVPVDSGGSTELDALTPLGEYANAAVARERLFQYFAVANNTPTATIRLNYAHDLHYGVLTDIAGKVWRGEPLDVTMGYVNAIWQGDANEFILRSLALCTAPAQPINLTSSEKYSVRDIAHRFADAFGKKARIVGEEAPTALLSNTNFLVSNLGVPQIGLDKLVDWISHWTVISGATYGKPTHFETRDGKY